jgi:pimeloyl-ACP methyl ester carboxylesterase
MEAVMDDRASWRAQTLGSSRVLELGEGRRVRAHVTGEGPPVVFVHGALVNANLWRKVVPRLEGLKRVTLDLPLGSHLEPLPKHADVSPPALADLIADAVEALDLDDVTLVGSDTGGGLSQILVTRRPERIGALVLASCDAFDNFPPRLFRIVLAPARIPGAIPLAFAGLRLRALRRLPIAYGWLTNEPIDADAEDSYVLPALTSGEVRRDLRRVLAGLDPRHTIDAALGLSKFPGRALIAWSAEDRFFPLDHGERLAKIIPRARFERIEGARTFSAEDRPERLADLIGAFMHNRIGSPV